MFKPQYTITNRLLANIKRINSLIAELNSRRFPHIVRLEFEKRARELSAHASTSIEGNPLSLTEVKKILKSRQEHVCDSEREVLNYNCALQYLDERLKKGPVPLTLGLILEIHRKVIEKLVPAYQRGKLRTEPVFVNDPRTGQAVYLPPEAKDGPRLIKELIGFTRRSRDELDLLIMAGIFHKQFVIIYPFMDGNGRTARLATKVLLAEMGLNTFNLFSFENYYNKNVTKYFKEVGLFGNYYELVEAIDFTKWLEYFTEGIIDELLRVEKQLPRVSVSLDTELASHHQEILRFIRRKGYITDRDYAKLVNRAKATRSLDFGKLMKMDLIVRMGKGRATYYKLASSPR